MSRRAYAVLWAGVGAAVLLAAHLVTYAVGCWHQDRLGARS